MESIYKGLTHRCAQFTCSIIIRIIGMVIAYVVKSWKTLYTAYPSPFPTGMWEGKNVSLLCTFLAVLTHSRNVKISWICPFTSINAAPTIGLKRLFQTACYVSKLIPVLPFTQSSISKWKDFSLGVQINIATWVYKVYNPRVRLAQTQPTLHQAKQKACSMWVLQQNPRMHMSTI